MPSTFINNLTQILGGSVGQVDNLPYATKNLGRTPVKAIVVLWRVKLHNIT
jgi:hypothetical protein